VAEGAATSVVVDAARWSERDSLDLRRLVRCAPRGCGGGVDDLQLDASHTDAAAGELAEGGERPQRRKLQLLGYDREGGLGVCHRDVHMVDSIHERTRGPSKQR
jgi:hypothetical protein